MDELFKRFLEWWNSLTPGARDQVVGGLIVAAIVALGSAVIGATRWLLGRRAKKPVSPPAPSVTPQPVIVQVQPTPPIPAERPVPRPPHRIAVPFVPRHNWEGRDWIERLSQALGEGGLVTIWGAGGTGKTTLAVEAVNRFFPAPFSGGLIYASADGRPDFGCETLLNKVLADFSREDARSLAPAPKADLVCHLLGEAMPCLLALDNFETIAREEQQAILAFLDHVSCAVLVTSRDQLPVGTNLRLGPMTPTEADAFLRSLVERSSQRARLERTDLNQVAEVAERNPMLMRWVVRQLEQAMRLEDVFDELARGKGEAAERIFGRSFQLLDGDGQTALLALSLFVPTASWEALAAVCGFDLERAKGSSNWRGWTCWPPRTSGWG
jgi:hypothetical protein